MAELKEYRYIANGIPTTGMLNERHAKALGAKLVEKPTPVRPAVPDFKARTDDVPNAARHSPTKAR